MTKIIVITVALLTAATCFASDQVSGTYSHTYKIKNHPLGNIPFGSSIKIKKLSETSASVEITLNEATAGSSCGGGLKGVGKLVENKINLTKTKDNETCMVSVTVSEEAAHVTQELNCSGFHGVGCSFDEAAANLPKIKKHPQNRKARQ